MPDYIIFVQDVPSAPITVSRPVLAPAGGAIGNWTLGAGGWSIIDPEVLGAEVESIAYDFERSYVGVAGRAAKPKATVEAYKQVFDDARQDVTVTAIITLTDGRVLRAQSEPVRAGLELFNLDCRLGEEFDEADGRIERLVDTSGNERHGLPPAADNRAQKVLRNGQFMAAFIDVTTIAQYYDMLNLLSDQPDNVHVLYIGENPNTAQDRQILLTDAVSVTGFLRFEEVGNALRGGDTSTATSTYALNATPEGLPPIYDAVFASLQSFIPGALPSVANGKHFCNDFRDRRGCVTGGVSGGTGWSNSGARLGAAQGATPSVLTCNRGYLGRFVVIRQTLDEAAKVLLSAIVQGMGFTGLTIDVLTPFIKSPVQSVRLTVDGSPLAAGNTLELADPSWLYPFGENPVSVARQWTRDNVDISGETGTSYTTSAVPDSGTVIRCRVAGTFADSSVVVTTSNGKIIA